jgi:hypothetical protein
MKPHFQSWILLLLVGALASACAGTWSRPLVAYNFDHPLLNSQWHGTYQLTPAPPAAPLAPAREAAAAQPEKTKDKVVATPAPASKQEPRATAARKTAASVPADPAPAAKEGPGFLPAAQRILGLRDFTTETYLRHLLFVTGVETSGTKGELATGICKLHTPNPQAAPVPGDLVFFRLNDGTLMAGVAESVDSRGLVRFLAPHRGEIRRLSAHLGKPGVIRDEASKTELNTVLDRNLTAGRAWLGPVGLVRSSRGPGSTLAARD